jgi:sugar phosphate isomerase/epimerase
MIEGLAALGVQGLEPFHTTFVKNPALIARYRRTLGDNGLCISAVDVLCDLVYSTPQERQQGRDDLRRGLEISAALGAQVAHVAGHRPKQGVRLTDGRKMIADGLKSEAEFATKHGLTLAIEDFGLAPTLLCKAADCLETLRFADGAVRFVFDVGNFEFAGEHADANLDALYEHICYVHFKDWRLAKARRPGNADLGLDLVGCPLGEGIVPGARVAEMLKARGYFGWVALETGALLDDPVSAIKRDLTALRRWME